VQQKISPNGFVCFERKEKILKQARKERNDSDADVKIDAERVTKKIGMMRKKRGAATIKKKSQKNRNATRQKKWHRCQRREANDDESRKNMTYRQNGGKVRSNNDIKERIN
jgi:hypothetical protein